MQAETGGLVINVFWILVVAANFLIFLVAAWYLGLRNLPKQPRSAACAHRAVAARR